LRSGPDEPDTGIRANLGHWVEERRSIDQHEAVTHERDQFLDARGTATEQGGKRDEWGAPTGHGGA
jgi:hypothetical protein